MNKNRLLTVIRGLTLFFILALVASGITAFPLEWELGILCKILSVSPEVPIENYSGLQYWIASVHQALVYTNQHYHFLAYGYDWLAFAHMVIAVAFIGVFIKPVRNVWIVYFGMIACVAIFPLAFICGNIRGIPFLWQLIDCSFGFFGFIVLWILLRYIRKLEKLAGKYEYEY